MFIKEGDRRILYEIFGVFMLRNFLSLNNFICLSASHLGVPHAKISSPSGRISDRGAMTCRLTWPKSMLCKFTLCSAHYRATLSIFSFCRSENPGLSGRFFVTALPTIFHVTNGQFRRYTGTRDMNAFMTFVEEKKWESIEPIDSWKRPDSVPMSILSWFFRLSHFLKVSWIVV